MDNYIPQNIKYITKEEETLDFYYNKFSHDICIRQFWDGIDTYIFKNEES